MVLQGELDRATVRLRAYEVLEEEVDQAVVRAAGDDLALQRDDDDAVDGGVGGKTEPSDSSVQRLLRSVKGIPCNPERRVKQAVYLAQRLLETERQRDQLVSRVAEQQEALAAAQEKAASAEQDLARSSQPVGYLVDKLHNEEALKRQALAQCARLEGELRRRKQSQLAAVEETRQLRERLFHLLEQRGELETVKTMVRQLCEVAAADDRDLLDVAPRQLLRFGGRGNGTGSSSSSGSDCGSGSSESDDEGSPGRRERRRGVGGGDGLHVVDTRSTGKSPIQPTHRQMTNQTSSGVPPFGLSPELLLRITSPPSAKRDQVSTALT